MPTLYFAGFGVANKLPRYTTSISDAMLIPTKAELDKTLTKELLKEVNVLELWSKFVKTETKISEKKVLKIVPKKTVSRVAARPAKVQKPTAKKTAAKKPAVNKVANVVLEIS